jgi:hypothetical protein
MPDWKRYQEDAAELFRELGCDVETDVEVTGARGKHLLDVSVRFSRFGLRQHWIVECKFWNRAVPKEKVLTLKSIVEDIGADRGIFITKSGYQSGAHASASHTNLVLTSLAQLRSGVTEEVLILGLAEIRRRAILIREFYIKYNVPLWEPTPDGNGIAGRLRAGKEQEAKAALELGRAASLILKGAEHVVIGNFPAPLIWTDDDKNLIERRHRLEPVGGFYIGAGNLREFVECATSILDELDLSLVDLKRRAGEGL